MILAQPQENTKQPDEKWNKRFSHKSTPNKKQCNPLGPLGKGISVGCRRTFVPRPSEINRGPYSPIQSAENAKWARGGLLGQKHAALDGGIILIKFLSLNPLPSVM